MSIQFSADIIKCLIRMYFWKLLCIKQFWCIDSFSLPCKIYKKEKIMCVYMSNSIISL